MFSLIIKKNLFRFNSFFFVDLLPSFVSIHYSNVCTIGLIVRVRTHKTNKTNEPKTKRERGTEPGKKRGKHKQLLVGFVNWYLIPNEIFIGNVRQVSVSDGVFFCCHPSAVSLWYGAYNRGQICKCQDEYICILCAYRWTKHNNAHVLHKCCLHRIDSMNCILKIWIPVQTKCFYQQTKIPEKLDMKFYPLFPIAL